jgi:tRNA/rRNA methyltransferase
MKSKRQQEQRAGIVLDHVTLVLTRPKYPGNIGSAARAAKNMGLQSISVVKRGSCDPEEIMPEVRRMATHLAGDIVERIRFFETLEEALVDFNYVIGTTSRLGSARKPVVDPAEMARGLLDISQHNQVAIVFGPEDFGLSNAELQLCHEFVAIPTAKELKSINLSHAVMIICYALFTASSEAPDATAGFTPKLATSAELEGMYAQLKDMFLKIDFINPENPDYWMANVRRFLSRIHLYSKEVQIIRGICRQVLWYSANKKT